MGKIIFKGIVILLIVLGNVKNVKAEKIIEIKIPDEIKIQNSELFNCCDNCKCDMKNCECYKLGDFDDYTEINKTPPTINESENLALQKIAIAESGNAGVENMVYVMQTVLNRKQSTEFPNTVEEVIKQKGQFSTYPDKYNKAVPNGESEQALMLLQIMDNKNQLFFENTVPGSWQSTCKEFVFKCGDVSYYK